MAIIAARTHALHHTPHTTTSHHTDVVRPEGRGQKGAPEESADLDARGFVLAGGVWIFVFSVTFSLFPFSVSFFRLALFFLFSFSVSFSLFFFLHGLHAFRFPIVVLLLLVLLLLLLLLDDAVVARMPVVHVAVAWLREMMVAQGERELQVLAGELDRVRGERHTEQWWVV